MKAKEIVDVRTLLLPVAAVLLLAVAVPQVCLGADIGLARRHHPWGHFETGDWKTVRVVTNSYEEGDTVSSVTETKTTLETIDAHSVSLLVEVSVDVGGKSIAADPQTVEQSFHGEQVGTPVKQTHLGTGQVIIQGRRIVCEVLKLESEGPTAKTVSKIYYSDYVEPYILRRETVKTDIETSTVVSKTTVSVAAMKLPCVFLGQVKTSYHVMAVHQGPKGTITTMTTTSPEIPGGVICYTSDEVNPEGQLVRRSSLQLVDYGESSSALVRQRLFPTRRRVYRFPSTRWQPYETLPE